MLAYVGGYTSTDRDGRAEGITVFRAGADAWVPVQTLATLDNPSLLRTSRDARVLYAVHGARTRISAYRVDPATGLLAPLGDEDSGGRNPVDLTLLPGGHLVAANYTSGTVAVLPVQVDGSLRPPCQVIALARPGRGDAQSLPHGVTLDPSGQFVLVPDKGLDCVFVFRILPDGQLGPAAPPFVASPDGSGPRHAVFHPFLPILYVINELSCTVSVFRWDGEALLHLADAPALPGGMPDQGYAAEIAVAASGGSVYASVRGAGLIARFAADPSDGSLGPADRTPCGGKEPRFFALSPDGTVLHVANQDTDTILSFPLDVDGRLGPGHTAAQVGSPTAICFGRTP